MTSTFNAIKEGDWIKLSTNGKIYRIIGRTLNYYYLREMTKSGDEYIEGNQDIAGPMLFIKTFAEVYKPYGE